MTIDVTERSVGKRAGYYYLSNDGMRLDGVHRLAGLQTAIGIANPDFLHVLGALACGSSHPGVCVAFDNNAAQLQHFRRLHSLVVSSENRFEFLERVFCIRLTDEAKQWLTDAKVHDPWQVPGAGPSGAHGELERRLWQNISFDDMAFYRDTGLHARCVQGGLQVDCDVVGGMENYLLTILSVDTDAYPSTPFSLRFGYGYLSSERAFRYLKRLLAVMPISYVQADAASDLVTMLLEYRYERMLLWVSNVFTPYFIDKSPVLGQAAREVMSLGTRVDGLPQIDVEVVADSRIPGMLSSLHVRTSRQRRRMTPHYKSFHVVRRWLLEGPVIEVVNMRSWITQDKGVSKLPQACYAYLDDFISSAHSEPCSTVFLHILLGHDASEQDLMDAFKKARAQARRVLVLEHNSRSSDFIKRRGLPSLRRITQLLGKPDRVVAAPGVRSTRRNWLLIYDVMGLEQ